MKTLGKVKLAIVDKLFWWLFVYVVIFAVAGWASGKLGDVLPVLTHLITGIAGAAFAIMRVTKDTKEQDHRDIE